jgi:hypothetical protein
MDHRRCINPEHEGPRYLPLTEFHKKGRRRGKQNYEHHCKTCTNRRLRAEYAVTGASGGWSPEKKRAYLRARSRAFTRLSKLVPELYQMALTEELSKEAEFQTKGN